ncbi:MAG: 50S ribosomal protein L29 [Candidatus Omnitrophota bacterium]
MKTADLRNMTKEELNNKKFSLKQELGKLRFQSRTGNLEQPASISLIKKDIARINTIIKEESYAK